MTRLLEARALEVSADGRRAGPISLDVAAGEFVALVGRAGSGKRMLLRALAGQAPAEGGQILFEGRPLSRFSPHDAARLGVTLVPRGGRVFQRLTVLENLELGAFARRETELSAEYDHVFELFPVLSKRRAQLASTLSRGERLMLAIGRALMSHPRLLLLDEPSAGLSPVVVEKLFEVLRRVNSEGAAVLVAEQAAGLALRAASRAWLLDAGELVASGACADLLARAEIRREYLSV